MLALLLLMLLLHLQSQKLLERGVLLLMRCPLLMLQRLQRCDARSIQVLILCLLWRRRLPSLLLLLLPEHLGNMMLLQRKHDLLLQRVQGRSGHLRQFLLLLQGRNLI